MMWINPLFWIKRHDKLSVSCRRKT